MSIVLIPTTCIYRVTVTVDDRAGGSDALAVKIEVEDKNEPPSAPARPTIRATEKSSTSLDVSWNAPENTGPPITSYDRAVPQGQRGLLSQWSHRHRYHRHHLGYR